MKLSYELLRKGNVIEVVQDVTWLLLKNFAHIKCRTHLMSCKKPS